MVDKKTERWQLERFAEALGDFPVGIIESGECPDFRVTTRERTFGIELTQLFHPRDEGAKPLREVESLRWQVATAASTIHAQLGGPIVEVIVSFTSADLTKLGVRPLAERIARLVLETSLQPNAWTVLSRGSDKGSLPDEIESIRVARFQSLKRRFWSVAGAGFVRQCTPELLQQAIDRKQTRVPQYRRFSDEIWLVIVADGFSISSTFELGDVTASHRYRCAFDRLFWFANFSRMMRELQVALSGD